MSDRLLFDLSALALVTEGVASFGPAL